MPNIETHAPGTFCWIELATTDQAAAKNFYTSLFGWTVQEFPMGPTEVYTIFQINGRDAAAGFTINAEMKARHVPPNWLVYVAVASADAAAVTAASAGGKALKAPFDVGEFGRMAVLQDPTNAVLAVWQSKTSHGTRITGEPGTLCWADLSTPDADRASKFYKTVFGWEIMPGQDNSGYLHIKSGEEFIGGVPPAAHRNPNWPPHWMAYFLVADCDASTNKAKELGGTVHVGPMTMEGVGRWSVIADPQGASFAVFQSLHRG